MLHIYPTNKFLLSFIERGEYLGYCIIYYCDFNSRCGDLSDYMDSFNDLKDIECIHYNTDVEPIDITKPRNLKMVLLMNTEESLWVFGLLMICI